MADLPSGFVLEGQGLVPPPPGFVHEDQLPTSGMSAVDKLLAGVGQGMTSTMAGAEQLAQHLGGNNPLSTGLMQALGLPAANVPPEVMAQQDKAIAQQAKLDAPLLNTTPGAIGSFGGKAAITAPLGAAGAVGEASWIPSILKAAASGGAVGALEPVSDVAQPKQLSELITGGNKGEDYLTAKLKQMGGGAAAGSAGTAALKGLGTLAENLLPSNATAQALNVIGRKDINSPFAAEGENLAAQTGVMLTPAQVSGNKAANMAENAARQSIFSRDLAFQGDKARTQQLADYFDRTLNGITASEASPAVAGAQVQAATKNVIGNLEKWRSQTANEDFGKIREMTKGQAAISPQNTNDLLQQIYQENSGIGTPGGDALANFAKKQLSNVSPDTQSGLNDIDRAVISQFGGADKLTPDLMATAERFSPGIAKRLETASNPTAPAQGNLDKLMQLRSYLSKVAGGQAKISGENQDRKVASQLLGSIDQDIESAGDQIGGDLGGALKLANARYREYSQQIDSVKASPLGKILGEDISGALQSGNFNTVAPETVMQRLGALKPTELGVVRGLLEQDQPQAWQMFKRGLLEDALEKAKQMPPSEGANTAVLRPNMLIKNMGDAKRLQAVFDPGELSQIQAGLDVARRLSDKTGYNFSGTAGQSETLGLFNTMKDMGVKTAFSLGGKVLGSRALASMMTNADGRAALMQLQRLPPGSAKARELTAYLASIVGTDDANTPNHGQ